MIILGRIQRKEVRSALSRSCGRQPTRCSAARWASVPCGSPGAGSGSLRYPGSLRAWAAAHSHSPDGAHLRTSCLVLAIGGLRSAHRRSVTGRGRVAGTGAFRRRMITRHLRDSPGAWQGLCAAKVIHMSTAPLVHMCAEAEQRIYPNYPQAYPQGVTLGRPKGCR
jgi:hypothetical protein